MVRWRKSVPSAGASELLYRRTGGLACPPPRTGEAACPTTRQQGPCSCTRSLLAAAGGGNENLPGGAAACGARLALPSVRASGNNGDRTVGPSAPVRGHEPPTERWPMQESILQSVGKTPLVRLRRLTEGL